MHELLIGQLEHYIPQSEAEAADREAMLTFLRTHDDALLRENRLAHFTASAWIVNHDRTKVLMAFHNLYRSWAWMGGHADGDGDLARVIRKEIAEECGLTRLKSLCDGIYGVQIIHVDHHIKRGSYVGTHLHLDVEYLFEADETDEVRIKEDENSGVGWIPIDRLAEFVSEEHMLPIYAWLNKKLELLP